MYPYIIHSDFLNVVVKGEPYMMDSTNPNFEKCIQLIKKRDWNGVLKFLDKKTALTRHDEVTVKAGIVYYRGEEIHSVLTQKMIELLEEGYDVTPMIKFLQNLLQNPSLRAVTELYSFLEVGGLPLTEDGCFLAYKRVRSDYLDIHSGKFSNRVGQILEMPREEVDWDRTRTCSTGFHFCSFKYLPSFSSSPNDRVMILKINPRDVVSIPADYNNTKGRTSRYEVFAEYDSKDKFQVPAFETSLVITKTAPVKKVSATKVEVKRKPKQKLQIEKVKKSGPARDANGRFIKKGSK